MTRISSAGGPLRRARTRAGIWLAALALVTLTPTLGHADPRDITVRWNPSPSEGVVSYVLSVGTAERTYTSEVVLTNPTVEGDVWSRIVQLESSVDLYMALRAVDGEEQYSAFSNEIEIKALGTPGTPFVVDPH